ncbi:MAG: hypothetical protein H6Q70_3727 [Firmicutes bacterium]|nr:hypothetical protein [Bacillota bacterium]
MADNSSKQSTQTTSQTTTQTTMVRPQRPGMVYVQDSMDPTKMINRGIIINEQKK